MSKKARADDWSVWDVSRVPALVLDECVATRCGDDIQISVVVHDEDMLVSDAPDVVGETLLDGTRIDLRANVSSPLPNGLTIEAWALSSSGGYLASGSVAVHPGRPVPRVVRLRLASAPSGSVANVFVRLVQD
ncbi:hypothetical protein [Cellulomonas cellasea]|uniref:Uncharacterized protein n=2 Tax=Cellulomonas cellasea TaxID=43670 RepID=A0A0A0B5B7_9CELL|nr:hypothetical protein [Cellulomonas cellasea]KGM02030.1 hypothetical protein Q760_15950 [Cellulomonas cellasea DSM 20118]GEA86631.1 hypothetical protein CCE01nite_05800 [Cellulomonas cellasea]